MKWKISLDSFYRLWDTHLKHVKVLTPCTDVCKTCRLKTREIVEKRNFFTFRKTYLVKDLSEHLEIVKFERQFCKDCILEASRCITESIGSFPNVPNSKNIMMHYSFDYKVQIFSISNEALKNQGNF